MGRPFLSQGFSCSPEAFESLLLIIPDLAPGYLKTIIASPVSILSSSFFELELILHSTKILVIPQPRLLPL